jgi:hypothetical protein
MQCPRACTAGDSRQSQPRLREDPGGRVALWPTEPVGLRFRLPFTVPRRVSGTTHGHSRARCECEEDVRSHRVLGAREVHLFSASMDRIYALKLRCEAGGLRRHAVDQRLPLACAPRDRRDRGGRGGHRSVDGGAPRRGGCDLAAISRAQARRAWAAGRLWPARAHLRGVTDRRQSGPGSVGRGRVPC